MSHGTEAVVTTRIVFDGSLRSVSGFGASMTSARLDEGPPLGHQCATGAPQLAYRNLMPSSRLSNGWLVRNGAPVLVAIDPRRGSESLRCFRGAAVAVASSRTAAVARRIAATGLVLKLDFQKGCYDAVSCRVAAPRPAAVNDDLFAAVLSILAAACSCTGVRGCAKLKASGL